MWLRIHRLLVGVLVLSAWLGSAMADEPLTSQFPEGKWKCGMGSYGLRECFITHDEGKVMLDIPDGVGHRMPLKGQLLGTDTDGEVVFDGVLSGKYVDFDSDCATEKTTDPKSCLELHEKARRQSMRLVFQRKKDGSWRGTLPFFIVRGKWNGMIAEGWYRHGATEPLRLVPKKNE
ncbi:MAG: hypothetical protein HUU55_11130 [Myxococcales bacterium]|nr:hypothetical protein [Myxococcales bacterium]